MMKLVTRYQAEDGEEFKNEAECATDSKNKKPGRKYTGADGWHYCGFCEFRSRDQDYMNDVHIPKHTKGWPK